MLLVLRRFLSKHISLNTISVNAYSNDLIHCPLFVSRSSVFSFTFPLPSSFHRINLLHQLHLFYRLTILCKCVSLLRLRSRHSAIYQRFSCGIECWSMVLIWMRCVSPTCVQTIVGWLSVTITVCHAIQTFELGSNTQFSVVEGLVCVVWGGFQSSLPLCPLLESGRLWEGFFDACVTC